MSRCVEPSPSSGSVSGSAGSIRAAQDFVCFSVADWGSPQRVRPDRSTVLTFYGGNWRPPEEMQAERTRLLTTPFSRYEASLRADLQRLLAGTGLDSIGMSRQSLCIDGATPWSIPSPVSRLESRRSKQEGRFEIMRLDIWRGVPWVGSGSGAGRRRRAGGRERNRFRIARGEGVGSVFIAVRACVDDVSTIGASSRLSCSSGTMQSEIAAKHTERRTFDQALRGEDWEIERTTPRFEPVTGL